MCVCFLSPDALLLKVLTNNPKRNLYKCLIFLQDKDVFMSAWKAGKIQWFNPEKDEGIIVDIEGGDLFYINKKTAEKLKAHKGRKKGRSVKYKTKSDYRATKVDDIQVI